MLRTAPQIRTDRRRDRFNDGIQIRRLPIPDIPQDLWRHTYPVAKQASVASFFRCVPSQAKKNHC